MAKKGSDGTWDLTPFSGCFPGKLSDAHAKQLAEELQYCLTHCPTASIGEGKLSPVPVPMNLECFQFQVQKLIGQVIVYSVKVGTDTEYRRYAGKLIDANGTLTIRLSERFNYIPEITMDHDFQDVPFPAAGCAYECMVSVAVYLCELLRQEKEKSAMHRRVHNTTITELSRENETLRSKGDSEFLAGFDEESQFDVWDPMTYGELLSTRANVLSVLTNLKVESGITSSVEDPVRQRLYDTCKDLILALAREEQPFRTHWPDAIKGALQRLRDYVYHKNGINVNRVHEVMVQNDEEADSYLRAVNKVKAEQRRQSKYKTQKQHTKHTDPKNNSRGASPNKGAGNAKGSQK